MTLEKGIRRHSAGHLEACVTINRLKRWKTFPKATSLDDVRHWRRLMELELTDPDSGMSAVREKFEQKLKGNAPQERPARWADTPTAPVRPPTGQTRGSIVVGGMAVQLAGTSFRDDLQTYYPMKTALRTLDERKYHLTLWAVEFGHRDRNTVTGADIKSVLARWGKSGHADSSVGVLSHGSLNKRRTALLDFYTVMNGQNGYNPVKDVQTYFEDKRTPWTLPSHEDALAAIDAVSHPTCPKEQCPKTQVRLRLMLHTGWPQAVIMDIRPQDIHVTRCEVQVHGRRKGRRGGTASGVIPVTFDALLVLKQFDALNCYGEFSTSSMHSALERACKRAGVAFFKPYMLRHKFITELARSGVSLQTVMRLALHTNLQQTMRYCQNADMDLMVAALKMHKTD